MNDFNFIEMDTNKKNKPLKINRLGGVFVLEAGLEPSVSGCSYLYKYYIVILENIEKHYYN
jgi:hypothetical protein